MLGENFLPDFPGSGCGHDFIREDQREIPAKSRMEAAFLFKSGMQDLFLNHVDLVETSQDDAIHFGTNVAKLRLTRATSLDSSVDFTLRTYFDTQKYPPYELLVTERHNNDRGRYRRSKYSVNDDGDEVVRTDTQVEPFNQLWLANLVPQSADNNQATIDGTFKNRQENLALEGRLGPNQRLVWPLEVRSVLKYLVHAKPPDLPFKG